MKMRKRSKVAMYSMSNPLLVMSAPHSNHHMSERDMASRRRPFRVLRSRPDIELLSHELNPSVFVVCLVSSVGLTKVARPSARWIVIRGFGTFARSMMCPRLAVCARWVLFAASNLLPGAVACPRPLTTMEVPLQVFVPPLILWAFLTLSSLHLSYLTQLEIAPRTLGRIAIWDVSVACASPKIAWPAWTLRQTALSTHVLVAFLPLTPLVLVGRIAMLVLAQPMAYREKSFPSLTILRIPCRILAVPEIASPIFFQVTFLVIDSLARVGPFVMLILAQPMAYRKTPSLCSIVLWTACPPLALPAPSAPRALAPVLWEVPFLD